MSDHLSLDLVTNILLRLPVAAVLRCRAICKPWRALIDSPRFSKLQIDHSSATTENAVLFILENDGHGNGDLHGSTSPRTSKASAEKPVWTSEATNLLQPKSASKFHGSA
ncbi:unnamed protein product [Linum trigynum]|uniref:F-box domain-containing protein n=1 Tax=Linum trigynum TaxID=586398 RepID=A0AAV2C793_9ROSI